MNRIKARAIELLSDGTVSRVIGWEKGETAADWSPALFETAQEMEQFVYGDYAGANLSKYTLKFKAAEGKTLVILKPCDTLSFNQLLHEHRIDREKVYIIGRDVERGLLCNGGKEIVKSGNRQPFHRLAPLSYTTEGSQSSRV